MSFNYLLNRHECIKSEISCLCKYRKEAARTSILAASIPFAVVNQRLSLLLFPDLAQAAIQEGNDLRAGAAIVWTKGGSGST